MPSSFVRAAVLAALPLTAAVAVAGAQQITTMAPGAQYLHVEMGEEQLPAGMLEGRGVRQVGQTFLATAASPVLQSFSFQLSASPWWVPQNQHPSNITMRAFVMEFDEALNRPTGPVLWTSAPTPGTTDATGYDALAYNTTTPTGWVTRTFSPGALALTPGRSYVALLSTLLDPALITDRWGSPTYGWALNHVLVASSGTSGLGYGDGHLYRQTSITWGTTDPAIFLDFLGTGRDGDGTPQISYNWDDRVGGADAAFAATFGPGAQAIAPEPTTVVLMAGGLAALGVVTRRRRR